MPKTFKSMSRDERAEVVRKDMAAGGSYKSVAAKYDTSVGQIAGICRDYGIASTHAPPSMGKPGRKPERKTQPPKLPAPKMRKSVPTPKRNIPGLIEAKSEASRCEYPDTHCPYEAKVGSPFCPLHQD